MKKIALIGSTGSIGVQTLNVVRRYPEKFKIVSLSAGNNVELLQKQITEFNPLVATSKKEFEYKGNTQLFFGENSFLNAVISEADIVVVALVGFEGILAVLEAINKGKNIALANKESLVVGGELVTKLARNKQVSILPVDSEHSAIWQALNFDFNKPFNKIILTASGGAFRDVPIKSLQNVTVLQALNHPNWKMGGKITVDCATMVNKAFEVIEAKWLYDTNFDKIDVILHRESIIHSMVELYDSSTIAQLSYPNMELPIQLALTYPERFSCEMESLNFAKIGKLTFTEIDELRYPCFNLVINAVKRGGAIPALINGANDTAVNLFLQGKINYLDIYKAIDSCLQNVNLSVNTCEIDNLIYANDKAKQHVYKLFGVK